MERSQSVYVDDGGSDAIPFGRHAYPFAFALSKELPSSFEDEDGWVSPTPSSNRAGSEKFSKLCCVILLVDPLLREGDRELPLGEQQQGEALLHRRQRGGPQRQAANEGGWPGERSTALLFPYVGNVSFSLFPAGKPEPGEEQALLLPLLPARAALRQDDP